MAHVACRRCRRINHAVIWKLFHILNLNDRRAGLRGFALVFGEEIFSFMSFVENQNSVRAKPFR